MVVDMVSEDRLEVLASFMLLHSMGAKAEFEEDAVKLKDAMPADRALWSQVCHMGRDLAPENPMFTMRGINDGHNGRAGLRRALERRRRSDRRSARSVWRGVEQRKMRRRRYLQLV